jgi:CRP/FNR family cyclic AMP-dependent transcriptional regulator
MPLNHLHNAESTLRQVSLFMEFDPREMATFLEFVDPLRFRKGEVLMTQGELAGGMYIVMEGRLRAVAKLPDGRRVVMHRMKSGDFFGELSIIDDYPRSADLVVDEDCVLLRVTNQVVETLFNLHPSAAFKILLGISRSLVKRLRESDKKLLLDFPLEEGEH